MVDVIAGTAMVVALDQAGATVVKQVQVNFPFKPPAASVGGLVVSLIKAGLV